jgi:hypothetical protein
MDWRKGLEGSCNWAQDRRSADLNETPKISKMFLVKEMSASCTPLGELQGNIDLDLFITDKSCEGLCT